MKKSLIMSVFLLFFLIGCGAEIPPGDEEKIHTDNTDYYYETNNKFIDDGHVQMKNGNYKEAVEYFTKAIEELPDYAYAYGFRGWAKFETGDLEGALIDVNKALELKNDVHDFYMWRARIYRAMGDSESADVDSSKAEELKSKFLDQQFGNI